MKYQFDVTLRIPVIVDPEARETAEEKLERVAETMLVGSPLAEECPNINYDESKPLSKRTYIITCKFKASIASNDIENASDNVPRRVWELVAGSPLAEKMFDIGYELSDEQPGLDELLEWIDDDQPFCIQADADRYHVECATEIYGSIHMSKALQLSDKYSEEYIISTIDKGEKSLYARYPKDGEGNLLHVIYGREWEHDVREAFAHKEEIPASCGACLGSLYDAPKEKI
jgi:hypothetical protein